MLVTGNCLLTTPVCEHCKDLELDALGQQLLQQSGLLQHRPPLQPGASGNPHYTLAPYQVPGCPVSNVAVSTEAWPVS